MFWKVFIFLMLLYFGLRFFVRFVAPIIRLTKDTRQHLDDMQNQMNQQQDQQQPKRKIEEEFIDYEEVK